MTQIKKYSENGIEKLTKVGNGVKSSTVEKLLSLCTETKILFRKDWFLYSINFNVIR